MKSSLKLAAFISIAAIFAILAFLLYFARPLFTVDGFRDVLSWHWQPFEGRFGILPVIIGSLCLSLTATLIAFPIGILISGFIYNIAPRPLAKFISAIIQFMTSIPTVVYAFVAAMVIPRFIRNYFEYGSGFSLLSAVIMLVILILPTIVLLHYCPVKTGTIVVTGL